MHNKLAESDSKFAKQQGSCLALYVSGSPADSLVLDEIGVVGDSHYGKDPERSVMLTSTIAYNLAKDADINIPSGALEENILVDIDPYILPIGTRINIGECILEISKYGTICKHLTYIDNKLPKLLKEKRGIFAKITKPGIIRPGDDVLVV